MRLDPSLILLNMSVIHQAGEAARDVEEMNRDVKVFLQHVDSICAAHESVWHRSPLVSLDTSAQARLSYSPDSNEHKSAAGTRTRFPWPS